MVLADDNEVICASRRSASRRQTAGRGMSDLKLSRAEPRMAYGHTTGHCVGGAERSAISEHWNIHGAGQAAVPLAPAPIREGPTRQGKCCVSSSRATDGRRSPAQRAPSLLCQKVQAASPLPLIARLCKRRDNFGKRQRDPAREPLVAPIKAHLSPELACNYVFHNAPTKSAVRGRRDWRAA